MPIENLTSEFGPVQNSVFYFENNIYKHIKQEKLSTIYF